jgi:beta-N-acetylhexosaminidase
MASSWQPGQLLFVGWSTPQPSDELLAWISAGRVGGVVLFRRNIGEPKALRDLVARLRAAAPADAPLVVAIDQEGGRVARLREPWTKWPSARTFGDRRDLAAVRGLARALATELLDLGIGLDFAPVVDVATREENPVIGDRSFSPDPHWVAQCASAFIEAAQSSKLATCAKHFPGHGDTEVDSHLALPTLPQRFDRKRLDAVELIPFRAAIASGVASMMTAHVMFPALDSKRPATLSPAVLEILRHDLGYDGLVFTDDLEMKAVADHFTPRERTIMPLEAGADVILICSQEDFQREALSYLERASDRLLEAPLTRLHAFKSKWARAPGADVREEHHDGEQGREVLPPYPNHEALAKAVAEARPWREEG